MPRIAAGADGDVASLDQFAERLSDASESHAQSTFSRVDFPKSLDTDKALFPDGSLTLGQHAIFARLDPEQRRQLGLLETVNFFSMNIHGEQALVSDLIERLYRRRSSAESDAISRYLQHFIHEENSHTYMLAGFCTRYYGRVMPEIVRPVTQRELSGEAADLLFFSRVYVLETLLDHVNTLCMREVTLEPTARAIHRSHHLDEARHMAFDQAVITHLVQRLRERNGRDEILAVGEHISAYAHHASRQLVSPRVYRECGIANALDLSRDVQASPAWRSTLSPWISRLQRFFSAIDLPAPIEP